MIPHRPVFLGYGLVARPPIAAVIQKAGGHFILARKPSLNICMVPPWKSTGQRPSRLAGAAPSRLTAGFPDFCYVI